MDTLVIAPPPLADEATATDNAPMSETNQAHNEERTQLAHSLSPVEVAVDYDKETGEEYARENRLRKLVLPIENAEFWKDRPMSLESIESLVKTLDTKNPAVNMLIDTILQMQTFIENPNTYCVGCRMYDSLEYSGTLDQKYDKLVADRDRVHMACGLN